jgi:hypothetical protein
MQVCPAFLLSKKTNVACVKKPVSFSPFVACRTKIKQPRKTWLRKDVLVFGVCELFRRRRSPLPTKKNSQVDAWQLRIKARITKTPAGQKSTETGPARFIQSSTSRPVFQTTASISASSRNEPPGVWHKGNAVSMGGNRIPKRQNRKGKKTTRRTAVKTEDERVSSIRIKDTSRVDKREVTSSHAKKESQKDRSRGPRVSANGRRLDPRLLYSSNVGRPNLVRRRGREVVKQLPMVDQFDGWEP